MLWVFVICEPTVFKLPETAGESSADMTVYAVHSQMYKTAQKVSACDVSQVEILWILVFLLLERHLNRMLRQDTIQ